MIEDLEQLAALVDCYDANFATKLRKIIQLLRANDKKSWTLLNDNSIWGGSGSLADQFLGENPGLSQVGYKGRVKEFRVLMCRIGERLIERGGENSRVKTWVRAFENWNQSGK